MHWNYHKSVLVYFRIKQNKHDSKNNLKRQRHKYLIERERNENILQHKDFS